MSAEIRRAVEDVGLGFSALRHLVDRVAEAGGLTDRAVDLVNVHLDSAEDVVRFYAGRDVTTSDKMRRSHEEG